MPDQELEAFKRNMDLVEYAKKAGFEPSTRDDGLPGLTFLKHPNQDAIVVARDRAGRWIYACVAEFPPRGSEESEAQARERLRRHIDRTRDKGTIVEFVQRRDWTARLSEVDLELVRGRLRDFLKEGASLDSYGALRPPTRFGRHPSDREMTSESVTSEKPPSRNPREPDGGPPPGGKLALGRRIGDWSPGQQGLARLDPHESLRRWQETQRVIGEKLRRARPEEAPSQAPPRRSDVSLSPHPPSAERAGDRGRNGNGALGQRHYDWTPAGGDHRRGRSSSRRDPDRDR